MIVGWANLLATKRTAKATENRYFSIFRAEELIFISLFVRMCCSQFKKKNPQRNSIVWLSVSSFANYIKGRKISVLQRLTTQNNNAQKRSTKGFHYKKYIK